MKEVINSIIFNMKAKYLDFGNNWRVSDDIKEFCIINFKNYSKLLEYSGKPILLKDYDGLGEAGDLVNVKPGFARNKLIPEGIALRASIFSKT